MARKFTDGFEDKSTARWSQNTATLSFDSTQKFNSATNGAGKITGNSAKASLAVALATPLSDGYIRVNCRFAGLNGPAILWLKGSTQMGFIFLNASGHLETYTGSGAGTLRATGTTTLAINTWYTIEIRILIDDVTGHITVRINGVQETDFVGDTKPASDTAWDILSWSAQSSGGGPAVWTDDWAVNDTTGSVNNSWPGVSSVFGKQLTSYGTYAEFTPSSASGNTTPTTAIDATDILQDELDGSGVAITGSWSNFSDATGYLGAYKFKTAAAGAAHIDFTPPGLTDGYWEIFEWHTGGANRPNNTPHVVTLFDASTSTVAVDQTINAGQWNSLGIFHLAASNAKLSINDNAQATKAVIVDGIRWVNVPDGSTSANRSRLYELPPDAVGNVQTNTTNKRDTFHFGALPADAGAISVVEVVPVAKAVGTPTPTTLTGITRISGTDYTSAATQTPGATDSRLPLVFETNPAISGAWTAAAVDAAEFGFKATA